jgi:hypothetical protein
MPSSERLARLPWKAWITDARLLLAGKTALAVGIAWLVAPLVPGVADDYPYYAPLGALISMSPTLMSSVKMGLQTLASLAIGIVLAGAVILLWEPNVLTISLVVGIGALVAGSRWLKDGGEYVPVAALFVLIIGGPDADAYSLGYIVQMSVGIAVGLVVNLAIFPPLRVTAAMLRIGEFRGLLATHLDEMAHALVEEWPPEHEEWATRSEALRSTADDVRSALGEADESRKGNPRARLHRRDLTHDYSDLFDLETITFHVRDLTDLIAASIWQRSYAAELPEPVRAPLSELLEALGGVLVARNTGGDAAEAMAVAEDALQAVLDRMDEQRDVAPSSLSTAAAAAMTARRILAIMAERPNGASATGSGG